MAAFALIAGCGSGSGSGSDEAAKTPKPTATAPVDYTLDQLKAALPRKDDVEGVTKVKSLCPGADEKMCAENKGTEAVSTMLTLAAAQEGSPADTEMRAAQALVDDVALVRAVRFKAPEAATASIKEAQASSKVFDGDFEFSDKPSELGLREKGTGSVTDLTVEGWTGFVAMRTTKIRNEDQTQDIQNALATASSGSASVSVNVVVDVTGRADDFAEQLARTMLAEYVDRLKTGQQAPSR